MAYEQRFGPPMTAVALTTGLKPRRFVTISSTKSPATAGGPYVKYPAAGGNAFGVLLTGSTGSTKANQAVTVMPLGLGIARVEVFGSSLHYGHTVSCSSVGKAKIVAGTRLGVCVFGTSGSSGHIASVLLAFPVSTA